VLVEGRGLVGWGMTCLDQLAQARGECFAVHGGRYGSVISLGVSECRVNNCSTGMAEASQSGTVQTESIKV
jgi:hypothetical protein